MKFPTYAFYNSMFCYCLVEEALDEWKRSILSGGGGLNLDKKIHLAVLLIFFSNKIITGLGYKEPWTFGQGWTWKV